MSGASLKQLQNMMCEECTERNPGYPVYWEQDQLGEQLVREQMLKAALASFVDKTSYVKNC